MHAPGWPDFAPPRGLILVRPLQRGVSLFKIAAWMGHRAAQVTELYAHLTAYDDDIGRLNSPTPAEKVAQPAGKPA